MSKKKWVTVTVVFISLTLVNSICIIEGNVVLSAEDIYPASDLQNTGKWILRADMSDEFEGITGV